MFETTTGNTVESNGDSDEIACDTSQLGVQIHSEFAGNLDNSEQYGLLFQIITDTNCDKQASFHLDDLDQDSQYGFP